ncbi:MAG: Flp pilus assembly protein CpaB [Candidatus Omnitrophica bacterium]|nr:Flp pilus assembly protein CpaB [Candidatus Omnitrophota bacterium]
MNPENKKQILIIVFAIGIGIVAAVTTGGYVQNKIETERALMNKQLQAKQQEFMTLQQQSQERVDALTQEIVSMKQQQEEIKQQAIAAAQAAAKNMSVGGSGENEKVRKPSLALRTPPGKRAVTVLIESLSAVGGLVDPGDFVDVIAQLNIPKGKNADEMAEIDVVTVMVFQHLQILAINTNLDDRGAYDDQQMADSLKITFAVEPQEAGFMSFVEKNGRIQLALRSPTEKKNEQIKTSTWKTLADYVLQNQGADIGVGSGMDWGKSKKTDVQSVDVKEAKPYIQIFRGGKEL